MYVISDNVCLFGACKSRIATIFRDCVTQYFVYWIESKLGFKYGQEYFYVLVVEINWQNSLLTR